MLSKLGLWISFFIAGMLAGFLYGKSVEKEKLDSFKEEMNAQVVSQISEREKIIDHQIKVTEQTNVSHQKAISDIRDYYANLLRQRTASNTKRSMPAVPQSSQSIDAVPADAISIAADCAETTRQLVDLQGWIVEQHELMP